ncbi:glycosyltransferase family 4 protein [Candidatus Methanomassiliicoccus intestinalis]|uniref:glycosyltransferase family 4 protein n=1 Tax=Candidatus Methanomassiliicoccus intestinalis TaxID=1406512 RepID=UPI0037DD1EAD
MNVVVLCRKLDGKPLTGFERYAHNLVEGLQETNTDLILPCQHTFFQVKPSGSLISPPYYDVMIPMWSLIRGRIKGEVYHALTDSQAAIFPLVKGKKIVTIHHVDKTPPIGIKEKIFRSFYAFGTKMSVKYADVIICISEQTKKEVAEAYGVEDSRLVVIPHAVGKNFCVMPKIPKEAVVGYVGALKNRKNLEFLIRTAAEYTAAYPDKPVKFSICGEGPERQRLVELTDSLGMNNVVEFKGRIADEEIVQTYNSFALFCLPSLQEGFGFPVIEAESCGIPVLTLKSAMMPQEVVTAATECSDEKDMARQIHRLLTDEDAYNTARIEGMAHAAQYTIERMAEETEKIYKKVLS